MARAIWKGVITIDSLKVGVKLYSAVQDRNVHFRLLHKKDKKPVSQVMVNPETDEPVDHEEIQRGAEIEPGVFVLLTEKDLKSLEPEDSRVIEIERFVKPGAIDHQWYERPYYVGPDDDAKEYWALVDALENAGSEGIALWTMRKKQYAGSLRVERGYLVLVTLRFSDDLILASELDAPPGRKLDRREVDMARQLIGVMVEEFRPEAFREEFRDRVLEFVEAKARGKKFKAVRRKKAPARASLAGALKASVAAARKRRHG